MRRSAFLLILIGACLVLGGSPSEAVAQAGAGQSGTALGPIGGLNPLLNPYINPYSGFDPSSRLDTLSFLMATQRSQMMGGRPVAGPAHGPGPAPLVGRRASARGTSRRSLTSYYGRGPGTADGVGGRFGRPNPYFGNNTH